MLTTLRRLLAALLIVSLTMPAPMPAEAAMLSTDAALSGLERERVADFLARPDVRSLLQSYGVHPDDASARVAALSDSEVARLAAEIDRAPAGGDALGTIVWVALVVFLVLLITDLLGLTKVFPFTKPIR
jgi:hypothetical protein